MKSEKLVKILAVHFSRNQIKIHSEYHIQVITKKGKNDIWLTKNGEIRFKPYGSRKISDIHDINRIIKRLKTPEKSHYEKMKDVLNLSEFIKKSEEISKQFDDNKNIFVDAGFKDGKAKVAAILFDNLKETMDIKVRTYQCENSYKAECIAIELGLSMLVPLETINVYTDNKPASEKYSNFPVKWISRKFNKIADSLSNLRK